MKSNTILTLFKLFSIGKLVLKIEYLTNRIKAVALLSEFKSVGLNTRLEWPLKVIGAEYITLGQGVLIAWHGYIFAEDKYNDQIFEPEIVIGDSTFIGSNCHIVACKKIQIGKRVMIADRSYISDNLHDYQDITRPIADNELLTPGEINIGDSSWIGENVCISGNITIGKHCVIGANSVVTKNIPDYSVAVGIPARIIKRYDPVTKKWRKTLQDDTFEEVPFSPTATSK